MHEKTIRLVLDTNTIISGLLWRGYEFTLLESIEQGKAQFFLSKEIIQEIDEVLRCQRLEKFIKQAGLSVEELLQKIVSLTHIIAGQTEKITICRDPDDNKIIECAIIAKALYIITGDKDLLVLGQYKTVKFITTQEALKIINA